MGPDLPSLCVWGPGLGAAPSALSKDVCALGEWSKGDGGQDGSSEQAHPQETTLLRSIIQVNANSTQAHGRNCDKEEN